MRWSTVGKRYGYQFWSYNDTKHEFSITHSGPFSKQRFRWFEGSTGRIHRLRKEVFQILFEKFFSENIDKNNLKPLFYSQWQLKVLITIIKIINSNIEFHGKNMKEFRANSKNLSRLHNLVFCSCRYSESLIFSRDAPERRSKKSDVISELLESKKLTPGIPVVSDQEGAQQQTVIKST